MSKQYTYTDKLEIKPLDRHVYATISVPASKSITNRALILAALASRQGTCTLSFALDSNDTRAMVKALTGLGYGVQTDWRNAIVTISKNDGPLVPNTNANIFADDSGTTARFITAMAAAGRGCYRIDGSPRLRQRPISGLVDALKQLGAKIAFEEGGERLPFVVESAGLNGGRIKMAGGVSSQFISAILMVAPFASDVVELTVEGDAVSRPYIDMTIREMLWRKLAVSEPKRNTFRIEPQTPKPEDSEMIEADATAASYFFAAAAVLRSTVVVDGYIPDQITCQGDIAFLDLLRQMGCEVARDLAWNTVHGSVLRGIDVDMNAISDTVPTLAAVGCFAEGSTTIRNVAHIRHKECDRISALCTELRKLGIEVEEYPDGLKITPRPMHGAEIETYNDHRIAMSMALIGLKVPGVVIKNPGCVAKTYPGYWKDFEKLYQ